ncbi:ABC-type transport auxiliary lipoprotein family protein [Erythrobacter sp. SDW2]|uniref:ABC-type transport auxiliary lipoprotein family protein n=1 Tax=Erythrobacter sp. SDW2 TaxID=2907154 RepID=UPI001F430116|nr:ABC-type transport auxiliary lipoprotein family protein [Erythrobacter sp. SDW2]UIP06577.1 ABC-type transport auxiliary lipoprotein family protein [Erythrobacter sp. SDW2]
MMRLLLAPFAALALTGCISLGGAEPPPTLLTLTADAAAPAGSGASGTGKDALTVVEPDAPASIAVTRVPVQVDDANVAYLQDAMWVEKPARLFRRLLSETIAAKTGRIVIDGLDPTIKTDQRLRGRILDFGYDARSASVVVRFEAIRDDAGGLVATRRFESVIPGIAAEPAPVGEALNRAANDVAGQVADWMGE